MSKNIKGLEFASSEPAFLRRMRGEISGQVDDADRQINPITRPQRPKRLDAEEDDGPTYVMEDSTTLSKEEYEALVKGESKDETDNAAEVDGGPKIAEEVPKEKQKIGGLKKRKAIKVIGADEDDGGKETVLGKVIEKSKGKGKDDEKKAPKKKKAKVNITFGDDEET